jgi:hypothetical protein
VGFERDTPVVGGNVLVREAIQSPNYVPGVSGWTINADGTYEFAAGGTFRGTVVVAGNNDSSITIVTQAGQPAIQLQPGTLTGFTNYNNARQPAQLFVQSVSGGTEGLSFARFNIASDYSNNAGGASRRPNIEMTGASYDGTVAPSMTLTTENLNVALIPGSPIPFPFRRSAVLAANQAINSGVVLTTVLQVTIPAPGDYDVTFTGAAFVTVNPVRPGFMFGGTATPSAWRFTTSAIPNGNTTNAGANNGGGTTSFSTSGTPFTTNNWPVAGGFSPFTVTARITFSTAGTLFFMMSDVAAGGGVINVVSGTTAVAAYSA